MLDCVNQHVKMLFEPKIEPETFSFLAGRYANGFLLVVGFKFNCLLVGLRTIGRIPTVRFFLRDPNIHEFWRKPRETPYGYVDKLD